MNFALTGGVLRLRRQDAPKLELIRFLFMRAIGFLLLVTQTLVLLRALPLRELHASDGQAGLKVASVRLGLGGKFKSGFWQPLWVTLKATQAAVEGQLEVVVADSDQTPAIYTDQPHGHVGLSQGEEASYLLYARSGPVASPITLQLRQQERVVWSHTVTVDPADAVRSTQPLLIGVGGDVGLQEAVGNLRRTEEGPVQVAAILTANDLPDRWWGYDGVDVLVLATGDPARLAALTQPQKDALVDWVLRGGRLVLSAGAHALEWAGDPRFGQLFPGPLTEVSYLRERSGLEEFTREELPLESPQWQRQRPRVAEFSHVRGEVVVTEIGGGTGRPLVVEFPVGLGRVLFVAVDLDHPALGAWRGRPRLLSRCITRLLGDVDPSQRDQRRALAHLGYRDLMGQLRMALDQFPGVWMVNFTTVAVLTLVYLLLAVPGDYLVLGQLGWARHRTWLTFPLVVIAATASAMYFKTQVHGQHVRLNQAEIIDIDLATQTVRGTAWCHFFSPQTARYTATLTFMCPPELVAQPPQGWLASHGLPGDGLGGLESRQPVLAARPAYQVRLPDAEPGLSALVMNTASTRSLAACWWSQTRLPAEHQLFVDRFGLLAGEFRQPLPVELTDCLLAHGEKLYRLGTLRPGQVVRLSELDPLNLEARLTQRRIEQTKDVTTPWEQDSTDVPRIVQMLMFHAAARGTSYTGLTHRYQPQLDLSEHIRLGQAVLVGRATDAVLGLRTPEGPPLVPASRTQHWTWYRLVIPVRGEGPALATDRPAPSTSASLTHASSSHQAP